MQKKIEIQIADPAGNITIFVHTPVERKYYQQVAEQLLENEDYGGEQVAFILPDKGKGHGDMEAADGSMEMCGLEFCGNASRAFALMLARQKGETGRTEKKIRVSGCEEPLTAQVDVERSRARIRMPNPLSCEVKQDCKVVDFGGILHVITEEPEKEALEAVFGRIRSEIYRTMNPPALGVMFWNSREKKLTPVVYVRDVETVYFEGSCGSGTTACAAAFSMGREDGTYSWSIPQPAGTIDVTAEVKRGRAEAIYIDSQVKLGEILTTEVEVETEDEV